MKKYITYSKFWKRKTEMPLWVPLVLFRAKSSLSQSKNPTDVASIAYQTTRKFYAGTLKWFFHFLAASDTDRFIPVIFVKIWCI